MLLSRYKPPLSPLMAKVIDKVCPYCKAAIGELCVTPSGRIIRNVGLVHDARISKKPSNRGKRRDAVGV